MFSTKPPIVYHAQNEEMQYQRIVFEQRGAGIKGVWQCVAKAHKAGGRQCGVAVCGQVVMAQGKKHEGGRKGGKGGGRQGTGGAGKVKGKGVVGCVAGQDRRAGIRHKGRQSRQGMGKKGTGKAKGNRGQREGGKGHF